jgi:type IV pilus assembly protein PilM
MMFKLPNQNKPKVHIGLDIGSTSVKLVELKEEASKMTVVRANRFAVDPADPQGVSKALQTALREVSLKQATIISVVTSPEGCFRKLNVPEMPVGELREALAWEVKEQIPFPIDDGEYDFEILQSVVDKGVKKYEVIVAVSPKEAIQDHLKPFQGVEIAPSRLIQGPFALHSILKKFKSGGDEPLAVLEMGRHSTELTIFRGGMLEISRKLPISGDDFTKALMVPLRSEQGVVTLNESQAEEVKCTYGMGQQQEGVRPPQILSPSQMHTLISPVAERLVSEIDRSLMFFQEQSSGGKIKRLFLFGSGVSLKGLMPYLSGALEIEVVTPNPFSDIPLRGSSERAIRENPHAFALALGAALSEGSGINLLPQTVQQETQNKVRRASIKGIGAFLSLSLLFLFTGMQIESINRQKKVDAARLELAALAVHVERVQQQAFARGVSLREPYWEDVLRELSHVVPEQVYLEQMQWEGQTLILKGSIVSPDEPEALITKMVFDMEKGLFKDASLRGIEKSGKGEPSSFQIEAQID